jgi:hypothetical protein
VCGFYGRGAICTASARSPVQANCSLRALL